MDDREKMREYLRDLSKKQLVRFFVRVHRRPLMGLSLRSMTYSVRGELIEIMLAWKENALLDWNRACEEAGIENENEAI